MLFQKRHHFLIIFFLIVFSTIIVTTFFASQRASAFSTTVTQDNRTSGTGSWSHTVGSSSNMVLLVGVSGNPSSVRYNNIALTKVSNVSQGSAVTSVWYLMNPPAGTYTVSVGSGLRGGAVSYYNVASVSLLGSPRSVHYDRCGNAQVCTGPITNFFSVSGTTNNSQATFSSAVITSPNSTGTSVSAGSPLWRFNTGNSYMFLGATNINQSGTTIRVTGVDDLDYDYVDIAVALTPVSPTATPTPTSTPTPTPTSYSISGNLYTDANKNGVKDTGEANYSGSPSITASRGTVILNSNGSYTITNLTPGVVTVSLNSLPEGYSMTYPLNGPPPSFQVTIGPGCTVNGASGASCVSNNITNLNFGITNLSPWFQSTCGDIRIDDGIENPVSAGNFSLVTNPTCTDPGIAFSGDSAYSFGQGQVSATNRIVGGTEYPEVHRTSPGSPILSSYTYLSAKATQSSLGQTDLASVCTLNNCTLPANLTHGIYKAEGDVTLNTYTFPANQNYIFLIDGTLTIRGNILVPTGSTSVFATTDDITVEATVGSAPSATTPNIEGLFVTDKSFIINSNNNCTDLRLNVRGAIITNADLSGGSLQNYRDLCGSNATYPTVSLTQRLDFFFNLPTFIKKQNSYSWEAAP